MLVELIILGAFVLGVYIDRLFSSTPQLESKLIEGKLDAIIEHLGVEYKPYKNTPQNVLTALKNGDRVKAIKLYRAFSGVGLKEASEIISHIEKHPESVA